MSSDIENTKCSTTLSKREAQRAAQLLRPKCSVIIKSGKLGRKGQECGINAHEDGFCTGHNPDNIAERRRLATEQREARIAKATSESPGPCQSKIRNGKRKGEVCGALILPGKTTCRHHDPSNIRDLRDEMTDYWDKKLGRYDDCDCFYDW